ncbi:MAG: sugar-binding domain-containing protein [Ignavibacteriaceae bacterium]
MLKRILPEFVKLVVISLFVFTLSAFTKKIFSQSMSNTMNSTSLNSKDNIVKINLNGEWKMKDFTRGTGVIKQVYLPSKIPAGCFSYNVPGTVRTSLLASGEIPDPYIAYDNEKSLWVEQKEWWFFKNFNIGKELKGKFVELLFEGTSFKGEVWINGKQLGKLEGMLNPHSFDVSNLLNYGKENNIAVRLEATPDAWTNLTLHGLTWRSSNRDQLYSIAQCMYGWDWGPHCVPIGLWQPVKLIVTGPLRISRPYIRSEILTGNKARCNVHVDVSNLTNQPKAAEISGAVFEKDSKMKITGFQKHINLEPHAVNSIELDLEIKDPKLWWPNGMGDQNLYLFNAEIIDGSKLSDSLTVQFGIRELKLVDNENVEELIKSMHQDVGNPYHLGKVVDSYPWTFEVNGKKMFAKGGNWIPVDQLLRLDYDRYDHLLKLVKEANFNLLRVWGGGLYETDDFYNLCDNYGILTWQEFLSNRNFSKIDRENFLDGVRSAVYRLRNHPSLTFWCGGNEFDPDDLGSKSVIDSLNEMLKKYDPQREFHRASPYMGDDHYWGVWHNKEPYSKYRIVRPFRSEAGINAPPVYDNYMKFTPDTMLWPLDTPYVEYRGESNTRFAHLGKLLRYSDEFGVSKNISEFILKSQLYQAIGNEFDLEFCRSNKFRNSGFLVWQFDDIWPCYSWSQVDWYGTPKPSYYFLKRASRPVHISADYEKYLWNTGEVFNANIYLLNDKQEPVENCKYIARILDVKGNTLAKKSGIAEAKTNQSVKIEKIEFKISEKMKGRSLFVSVILNDNQDKEISYALYPIAVSKNDNPDDYNDIFEELNQMPQVPLKVSFKDSSIKFDSNGNGITTLHISNPSDNLAFFVGINMIEESKTLKSGYSDNYVALLPGDSRDIIITFKNKKQQTLPGQLSFKVAGWNTLARNINLEIEN